MLYEDQHNADLIRQQLISYVSSEYICQVKVVGHIVTKPITNYSKLVCVHSKASNAAMRTYFKPKPSTNYVGNTNKEIKLRKISISSRKQLRWNALFSVCDVPHSDVSTGSNSQALALSKLHSIVSSIRGTIAQVVDDADKCSFEITIIPCEKDTANCDNLNSTVCSLQSYKEKEVKSSQDLPCHSPLPKITLIECHSNKPKIKRARSIVSCS
jgi:hypothetical protein